MFLILFAIIMLTIMIGLVFLLVSTLNRQGKSGINFKKIVCSKCGTELPRTRKPANMKQALWGGFTCPNCGTELDKWGQQVEVKDKK